MAYQTVTTFTCRPNGWTPEVLKHPVMAFMHGLTKAWLETRSGHSEPYTNWMTDDFVLHSHTGKTCDSATTAKAFIALAKTYAAATININLAYIRETETGYEALMTGNLYINFVVPGEKTCRDAEGRDWELCIPRAYDFTLVRDKTGPAAGLKVSKMLIYGDRQPAIEIAAQRGLPAIF
ncbi:hypothetical protein OQA88_5476 [Cercophora sp. LCS_1]